MSNFNLLMNNPSFVDKARLISSLLSELREDLKNCAKNNTIEWES